MRMCVCAHTLYMHACVSVRAFVHTCRHACVYSVLVSPSKGNFRFSVQWPMCTAGHPLVLPKTFLPHHQSESLPARPDAWALLVLRGSGLPAACALSPSRQSDVGRLRYGPLLEHDKRRWRFRHVPSACRSETVTAGSDHDSRW